MPNEQKAALTKADNIVAFSGAFFYTYIYRTSTFLHGAVYPAALTKARDLAKNPGNYIRATSYGAAKYVKK